MPSFVQKQGLRQKKETQVRKHLEVPQSCCCALETSQPRQFRLLIRMPPGCPLEPTEDFLDFLELLTHLIRAHLEISCNDREDAAGKRVWSSSLSTVPPWPDLDEKVDGQTGVYISVHEARGFSHPLLLLLSLIQVYNEYIMNTVHIFWKMVHQPAFFFYCSAGITKRLWKDKRLKFSLTFHAIKLNQDL